MITKKRTQLRGNAAELRSFILITFVPSGV
jgi:hypothetical protein